MGIENTARGNKSFRLCAICETIHQRNPHVTIRKHAADRISGSKYAVGRGSAAGSCAAAPPNSILAARDTIGSVLANRDMWIPLVNGFTDGTKTERLVAPRRILDSHSMKGQGFEVLSPARYFPLFTAAYFAQPFTATGTDELDQGSLEHFAEEFLFLRGELLALPGKIEHVDGFVAFRIDQRDFDVAS